MDGSKHKKCVCILLTLISCQLVAGEKLTAVTELFPPYQQLNADNTLSGFTVDLVYKLAEPLGDELDIHLLPWSVAYGRALHNPDVMIFSIGQNQDRQPLFHWIGPIATESLYFWALPRAKIPHSEELSDFRAFRISVVKDATTHQYLTKEGFESLYVMGGTDSNVGEHHRINMLMRSRADIVISTTQAIKKALVTLGLPDDTLERVHRARELDTDLYIGFSIDSRPELVKRYERAMGALEKAGDVAALKHKWGVN